MNRVKKALAWAVIGMALASIPVLAAYAATLDVSNNSSTSYGMLPVIAYVDNSFMAANGFFDADALDTRVEDLSGNIKPHLVADNKTLLAIPSANNSITNLLFTTGNTPLTSMPIITGYGGYLTTTDAANLEFGSNFTLTLDGYVDMAQSGTLYQKSGAAAVRSDSSTSNVTAWIFSGSTSTANITPSANGTYQQVIGAGGYTLVDDPPGSPDDAATQIITNSTSGAVSSYQVTDLPSGSVSSIAVFFRFRADNVGGTAYVKPVIYLNGANTTGTEQSVVGLAWATFSESLARPGGGSWTLEDVNALEVGFSARINDSAFYVTLTQIYAGVNYNPVAASVTATSVSSGEHEIMISENSTHLWISIDGVSSANTTSVAAVLNNSNNHTFALSNTMPYINDIDIKVGGNQQLYYAPNAIIVGTTLPDRGLDATSNPAIITWGTNPSGVSVTLGSMLDSGVDASGVLNEAPPRDVTPESEVSNWFTDTDMTILQDNPLRPFVTLVSDNTDLTETQTWRYGGFIFVILTAVSLIKVLRGHLGLVCIGACVAIIILVVQTIWPLWTLIVAVGLFLGGLVLERTPSYG
jgi:hypothetical protein